MSRPEHEQLPDYLRKGIDDELARMQAEDQICAGSPPSPLKGLVVTAVIIIVLVSVLGIALGRGTPVRPDVPIILVTPLTTYGAPSYVP